VLRSVSHVRLDVRVLPTEWILLAFWIGLSANSQTIQLKLSLANRDNAPLLFIPIYETPLAAPTKLFATLEQMLTSITVYNNGAQWSLHFYLLSFA
jgi:hypothetical protein